MKMGFLYKGHHSNEFGIIARTKSRPILPEQKRHEVDAPNIDGSYDFSDANVNERAYYEDRINEVEISFFAKNIQQLQERASKVAVWLTGSGDLIFDDTPAVVWKAKVIQQLDFAPIMSGRAATVTVYFRCKSWAENEFDTNGLILGSRMPLNSDIPLDMSADYTFHLNTGENVITFDNLGSWYVRPVFEITASNSIQNIDFDYGGKAALSYSGSGKHITVDCQKQRITADGKTVNDKMTGVFPEFPPGNNEIRVTVGAGIGSLFICFKPLFVYGYSWAKEEDI